MGEDLQSELDAIRAEVRAWLASNWNPEWRSQAIDGPDRIAWLTRVVEAGWAAPRWPVEWFGRGWDDARGRVVESEFARAGAFGTGQDRTNLWSNTVLTFGTPMLKARLIGGLLRGEVNMCLLYSEPGAGSDLAGVRTRAERTGDEWVVNGQKVWTSRAKVADYGMLIARTDWDVPKHSGHHVLLVPDAPARRRGPAVAADHRRVRIQRGVPHRRAGPGTPTCWASSRRRLAGAADRAPYERSVMGESARGPRSGVRVDTAQPGDADLVALARRGRPRRAAGDSPAHRPGRRRAQRERR